MNPNWVPPLLVLFRFGFLLYSPCESSCPFGGLQKIEAMVKEIERPAEIKRIRVSYHVDLYEHGVGFLSRDGNTISVGNEIEKYLAKQKNTILNVFFVFTKKIVVELVVDFLLIGVSRRRMILMCRPLPFPPRFTFFVRVL